MKIKIYNRKNQKVYLAGEKIELSSRQYYKTPGDLALVGFYKEGYIKDFVKTLHGVYYYGVGCLAYYEEQDYEDIVTTFPISKADPLKRFPETEGFLFSENGDYIVIFGVADTYELDGTLFDISIGEEKFLEILRMISKIPKPNVQNNQLNQ